MFPRHNHHRNQLLARCAAAAASITLHPSKYVSAADRPPAITWLFTTPLNYHRSLRTKYLSETYAISQVNSRKCAANVGNNSRVIIIIIIPTPKYSSRHGNCQSSPGSCDQCRLAARRLCPTLRPSRSASRLLPSTATIAT